MRDKTIKLSEKHYKILTEMLKNQRQRAQVIEGLIDVLAKGVEQDKYILYDVMNDPLELALTRVIK